MDLPPKNRVEPSFKHREIDRAVRPAPEGRVGFSVQPQEFPWGWIRWVMNAQIDPQAEMVIARFASHPLAGNMNLDPTSLPAYRAIADQLLRKPR